MSSKQCVELRFQAMVFISTEERGKFAEKERKYITIPARAGDFNEKV